MTFFLRDGGSYVKKMHLYPSGLWIAGDLEINNKIMFTNLVASADSGLVGSGEGCYIVFPSYTKDTTTYDGIELYRQETWVGFHNRTDGIWTAMFYECGERVIAGDLKVGGNDIKDSGGNMRITLGDPTVFACSVKPSATNTYDLGASAATWKNIYGTYVHALTQLKLYADADQLYFTTGTDWVWTCKPADGKAWAVWDVDATVWRAYLTTAGDMYAYSYNTISLRELKEDIRDADLKDVFEILSKIRIGRFKWEGKDVEEIELIAE